MKKFIVVIFGEEGSEVCLVDEAILNMLKAKKYVFYVLKEVEE